MQMFMIKVTRSIKNWKPVKVLMVCGLLVVTGIVSAKGNGSKMKTLVAPKHPNILIIMTDQQSATMLSCAENKWLHTPALDNLAATCICFEKAYVTNPVCMPSRFFIQTVMLPSVIGIRANDMQYNNANRAAIENLYSWSMGSTFRKAGYDTYYGGKFHVPLENRNPAGWGYEVITKDDREDLANDVSTILQKRKSGDKPFLMFASFINPHDICFDAITSGSPESEYAKATPQVLFDVMKIPDGVSKKDFFDKYCPPLPANCQPMLGESYTVDSLIRLRDFRKTVRDKWSDEDWCLHRWAYARLVERVDVLIGNVLTALEKSGFRKNTIVIFISDHRDNDASNKLEQKTVFYEESARVPFIISYPWLKNKYRVDSQHIVSNGLDVLPTLYELANIQPPQGLSGSSLVPILDKAKGNKWRDHIIIENELGYLIHTGRYKYELDDKCGDKVREVFSDLHVDPGETINMISDSKYAKIIKGLRTGLLAYLGKYHIPVVLPLVAHVE
jgi:arylsulfatase A-like enzyme